MVQKTRKQMTMCKNNPSKDDVDRQKVLRDEGGTGLANIEDCVDVSIQRLEDYIKMSKERLIRAARNGIGNIRTNRKATKTKKEKQLYVSSDKLGDFSQEDLAMAKKGKCQ